MSAHIKQSKETRMAYTAEEAFLLGGARSATFAELGDVVTGKVVEPPVLAQQKDFDTGELKTWQDGSPMMQLVVTVDTGANDPTDPDDDGVRKFYVRGNLKAAVAKAVKAAGAGGIKVGGVLSVTYSGNGIPSRKGFKAPKEFTATYQSPANASLAQPDPAPAAAPQETAGLKLTPETLAALQALQSGNQ